MQRACRLFAGFLSTDANPGGNWAGQQSAQNRLLGLQAWQVCTTQKHTVAVPRGSWTHGL